MRYTLQDYSDVLFSGFTYKLPDNVSSIVGELTKELGVINNDKVETKETENIDQRTRRPELGFKRTRYSDQRIKGKADDSWKMSVPFKATIIEKKEGLEKQTNDVRVCLNKISNKNYQQQRDTIFELIENMVDGGFEEPSGTFCSNLDRSNIGLERSGVSKPRFPGENSLREFSQVNEENSTTSLQHVAQSIFDIASSNKFYSELYAGLYKDLINNFSLFSVFIINLIDEYYESMNAIKNIDSNEDYNLYCENNKINDKRKATSMFINGAYPSTDRCW